MHKQLTHMTIFSTEEGGFNKEQVGNHISEISTKYYRSRRINRYLIIGGIVVCIALIVCFVLFK